MGLLEAIVLVSVLLGSLAIGIIAHEFAHAAVLFLFEIEYEVEWLPDRTDTDLLRAGLFGSWATVTPVSIPPNVPAWGIRAAAVAPAILAVPALGIAAGLPPYSLWSTHPTIGIAAIAFMACAIPSPSDFSLFWHANDVVEDIDFSG